MSVHGPEAEGRAWWLRPLVAAVVIVAVVAVAVAWGLRDGDPPEDGAPAEASGHVQCPKAGYRLPSISGGRGPFDATKLIGMTVDEAGAQASEHGCAARVVREDGEHLLVTLDLDEARVNLIVEGDRVVGIDGVY